MDIFQALEFLFNKTEEIVATSMFGEYKHKGRSRKGKTDFQYLQ